jgi:hypothetical protein
MRYLPHDGWPSLTFFLMRVIKSGNRFAQLPLLIGDVQRLLFREPHRRIRLRTQRPAKSFADQSAFACGSQSSSRSPADRFQLRKPLAHDYLT